MIKNNKLSKVAGSLKLKFLIALLLGLSVSAAVFFGIRSGFDYYINKSYLSQDSKKEREEDYLEDLQSYINENYVDGSSDAQIDARIFSRWAKSQKYVYLMVYKDDQLFYSSDMEEEKPDGEAGGDEADGEEVPDEDTDAPETDTDKEENEQPTTPGSGLTATYPTYEELKEYAAKNGTHLVTLGNDGAVFASIAEFTEYFYYDLSNITGLVAAILLFAAFMLLFFTRIMVRITRLAADVNRVSAGELNYSIGSSGSDEISRLSSNVENMRSTILENLKREREAREANTELVTSMSHDIRTPLTVLLGYIDVMKQNSADETMSDYLRASETTALRMKKLSDDMFNYFLVFGNDGGVELEDYNAYTLLTQMLDEHILLLNENGHRVELSEPLWLKEKTVRTDAQKLMRIIDNIFSNLYKYSDASEPIKISLSDTDGEITLEFRNKIKKSAADAESNRIGLKSCVKLAGMLGVGFECGERGEYYVTAMEIPTAFQKDNGGHR